MPYIDKCDNCQIANKLENCPFEKECGDKADDLFWEYTAGIYQMQRAFLKQLESKGA